MIVLNDAQSLTLNDVIANAFILQQSKSVVIASIAHNGEILGILRVCMCSRRRIWQQMKLTSLKLLLASLQHC